MPRSQETERVVVVRADINGNILDYNVVEQPIRSDMIEKPPSVNHSRIIKQSPKLSRTEIYEEENHDDVQESKESFLSSTVTPTKTRRDTSQGKKRKPRRVRYVRPKSTVKIFEQKLDWNASSKIDSHNDDAIEKILSTPKKKIFDEKRTWPATPKIDSHNEESTENFYRTHSKPKIYNKKFIWTANPKIDSHNDDVVERILQAPKPQIYDEKIKWNGSPKIDSHNYEAVERILQTPKPQIYNEKIAWSAGPKIDSHNEEIVERLKSAPKPIIYDQKFKWSSAPRIDHYNEEFVQHKEREKIIERKRRIQREKTFRSLSRQRTPKISKARIEHQNPKFDEHIKRQKTAKLPPIEDRKLKWQKQPRINQRNDDYIEHIGQKQSTPTIFQEKLRWSTITPRIDAHNEEFLEHAKKRPRPKIVNQLPRWNSQVKIDAHNESFDPDAHISPTIVNEKLQWHARPKIDTGLVPESDEDEYIDDSLAA